MHAIDHPSDLDDLVQPKPRTDQANGRLSKTVVKLCGSSLRSSMYPCEAEAAIVLLMAMARTSEALASTKVLDKYPPSGPVFPSRPASALIAAIRAVTVLFMSEAVSGMSSSIEVGSM